MWPRLGSSLGKSLERGLGHVREGLPGTRKGEGDLLDRGDSSSAGLDSGSSGTAGPSVEEAECLRMMLVGQAGSVRASAWSVWFCDVDCGGEKARPSGGALHHS